MERKWKYIMIHHSLSKDGRTRNTDAIRNYHTSWRHAGVIITKEYAQKLISKGITGILRPWRDIGYHALCEYVEGEGYITTVGRPLDIAGAHCLESGMNMLAIGFCYIGNFDVNPPNAEQLLCGVKEILKLAEKFNMGEPKDYIKYHTEYATYKSCPGKLFPKKEVFCELLEGTKNAVMV